MDGKDGSVLILKVWSTMGYSAEHIREQATSYVHQELGHDLQNDNRVRFVTERLSRRDLIALYQACDAFVLPSRGEGWGRPFMEAMACGKPVIGTNWSGNTAFMTTDNSYLLNYRLTPVPENGWRELPTYRGHQWAEPDENQLVRILQGVRRDNEATKTIGERARQDILTRFSPETVGRLLVDALERISR